MSALVATQGYLTAFWYRSRTSGTSYWAFTYLDVETGKEINGKISGGESNIYGILRYWDVIDDWDRSIEFKCVEMKERAFDRMVKDWEYAGCLSLNLANYIRRKLGKTQQVDVRVEITARFTVIVPSDLDQEDALAMAYREVNSQIAIMQGNKGDDDLGDVKTAKAVFYPIKKEPAN